MDERARQSLDAIGRLFDRTTPWLTEIGKWIFGGLIAIIPFRRRERWAWWALWFYPVFWTVHLVGGLPPGEDHLHQVVFIALSLVGLLLPARPYLRASAPTPAPPGTQ